jgi:hypothetical protein
MRLKVINISNYTVVKREMVACEIEGSVNTVHRTLFFFVCSLLEEDIPIKDDT